MFHRLTRPPSRAMHATRADCDSWFSMFRLEIPGERPSHYSAIREKAEFGTVEIFSILGGDEDYVCSVSTMGDHRCDCPDFIHHAGRLGEPCKHLYGLLVTGIMMAHCPTFLKPKDLTNDNEATAATATPERHADENCPAA